MKEEKIPSVLIVDSDSLNQDSMIQGLEKYGYVVTMVDTGKKAIEFFSVQRFDVVLLEIDMPDMNGIEILREVKSIGDITNTKIIMVSEVNDPGLIKQCKEEGAVDYLLKPLSLSNVVKHIDNQLGSDFSLAYRQTPNLPDKAAKILIVDDEELNRDVLDRRLKKIGYTTVLADGAAAASKALQENSIDLILLDILMPEVDGIDFLAKLKKSSRFKLVPVIMLTALSDKESVARCIQLGAEAYLLKPFDAKQLQQRIEQSLNNKEN